MSFQRKGKFPLGKSDHPACKVRVLRFLSLSLLLHPVSCLATGPREGSLMQVNRSGRKVMAIPLHLWLTDQGGAAIRDSSQVKGREGGIELLSFSHGMRIPTDGNTGKLTGGRSYEPMIKAYGTVDVL